METHHEYLAPPASEGEAPVRAFIATAHPASPDSWAAVARLPPLLRVEPSGGDAESVTTATADGRQERAAGVRMFLAKVR